MNEKIYTPKNPFKPSDERLTFKLQFCCHRYEVQKVGRGKNTFLDIWGLKYLHKANASVSLQRQDERRKKEKYFKVILFLRSGLHGFRFFFFVLFGVLRFGDNERPGTRAIVVSLFRTCFS